MGVTDNQLLSRWAQSRDADAFREIALRHAGMVYGTCRRILLDAHEAEDVSQECFLLLATKGAQSGSSLGAWLHRVATNLSLNRVRDRKRLQAREDRYASENTRRAQPIWNDISPLIDEAINALPERVRVPLVLHFFEDMTHEAIANHLAVSRSTVTNRIHNGIDRVRDYLKKQRIDVSAVILAPLLGDHLHTSELPATLGRNLSKLAVAGEEALVSYVPGRERRSSALKPVLIGSVALLLIALAGSAVLAWKTPATREHGGKDHVDMPMVRLAPAANPTVNVLPDAELFPSSNDSQLVPATNALVENSDQFTIQGVVTDVDGNPVPEASVIAFPEYKNELPLPLRPVRAATSTDGSFSIQLDKRPAVAQLIAQAPAFLSKAVSASDFERLPTGPLVEMDFILNRGTSLHGVIVLSDGQEAADAIVIVRWIDGGLQGPPSDLFTAADSLGRFCLSLPDGEGTVDLQVCSIEGHGAIFLDVPLISEPITLELPPTVAIVGTAFESPGTPCADCQVEATAILWEREPNGVMTSIPYSTKANVDGLFALKGLPSGFPYSMRLRNANGEQVPTDFGRTSLLGPGVTQSIELVGRAEVLVRGRVLSEVTQRPAEGFVYVTPISSDSWLKASKTDSDGNYSIALTDPGEFLIEFKYDLMTCHEGPECRKVVRLMNGENVCDLIAPELCRVPIRVVDAAGHALAGVEANLCRLDPETDTPVYMRYLTSNGGRAEIRFVPGCEYWIAARADGYVTTKSAPMKGIAGEMFPEITLILRRRGTISGQIVDVNGAPMPYTHYNLYVYAETGDLSMKQSADTDEFGRFELNKGLTAENLTIKVDAWHDNKRREIVALSHEGLPDEDLDLGPIVFDHESTE